MGGQRSGELGFLQEFPYRQTVGDRQCFAEIEIKRCDTRLQIKIGKTDLVRLARPFGQDACELDAKRGRTHSSTGLEQGNDLTGLPSRTVLRSAASDKAFQAKR